MEKKTMHCTHSRFFYFFYPSSIHNNRIVHVCIMLHACNTKCVSFLLVLSRRPCFSAIRFVYIDACSFRHVSKNKFRCPTTETKVKSKKKKKKQIPFQLTRNDWIRPFGKLTNWKKKNFTRQSYANGIIQLRSLCVQLHIWPIHMNHRVRLNMLVLFYSVST